MTARQAIALLRWMVAVIIAIAGVSYSSWVLEFILPIGLDPTSSFLSELSATGRPYREIFGAADTLTGTLLLLSSTVGRLLLPRGKLATVGWLALGAFGAATVADSLMPITCIPTPEHPCPGRHGELFPQLHSIHALTSTIAVTSIFVAMISFSAGLRGNGRLRNASLWFVAITSTATAWMLIADNLPGDTALGIAQRTQVGSMSLWLITFAATVLFFRTVPVRETDETSSAPQPKYAAHDEPAHPRPPSSRHN